MLLNILNTEKQTDKHIHIYGLYYDNGKIFHGLYVYVYNILEQCDLNPRIAYETAGEKI